MIQTPNSAKLSKNICFYLLGINPSLILFNRENPFKIMYDADVLCDTSSNLEIHRE